MIALLRGRVASVDEDMAVVETGGVGYAVICHARTLAWLREQGTDLVEVQIHTSVSEDAIRLYGFASADELRLFRLLISVERIGPKAAQAILGRSELRVLVRALQTGDVALLGTAPGIGRKTAERIVLELRDKLDWLAGPASSDSIGVSAPVEAAVAALTGLGFREHAARTAMAEVCADTSPDRDKTDVNLLVAAALRHLDTAAAN